MSAGFSRRTTPRSSLDVFRSVVYALFLRELQTRFGTIRLGYLWAVLEPAAQVLVLVAVFGFASRHLMPGLDFAMFVLTGLMPFQFFRQMVGRSMDAIDANRALFGYRQVMPIDTLIARLILESLVNLVVFAVLIAVCAGLGMRVGVEDPLGLLGMGALLVLISFGLGLACAVLGQRSKQLRKVIPLVLNPLYFVSGVFFPMALIPEKYLPLVIWNPILHLNELVRDRYFLAFRASDDASLLFVISFGLISLLLGLALYRRHRLALVAT